MAEQNQASTTTATNGTTDGSAPGNKPKRQAAGDKPKRDRKKKLVSADELFQQIAEKLAPYPLPTQALILNNARAMVQQKIAKEYEEAQQRLKNSQALFEEFK